MQGFCAETGGAITLFMSAAQGAPISTPHMITGEVVGFGAAGLGGALERRQQRRRPLGHHPADGSGLLGVLPPAVGDV